MMEKQQGNFNNKDAAPDAINNVVKNVAKDDFPREDNFQISNIRKQFKRIILNVGGHDTNDYQHETLIKLIKLISGVKHEVMWRMLLHIPDSR